MLIDLLAQHGRHSVLSEVVSEVLRKILKTE